MSDQKPEQDQEMPLVSHLTELRTRLLRCVAAIFLIFAGLFYFAQKIYTLVSAPLRQYLPEGATMIATDVASPFLTPFKLTMVVALFLAMPVILHQVWGFIAPGLYKHEKRIALPLLVSSIVLFYAGMAFASQFPNFKEKMQYAAGLGLRYYTPIGPIRVDVAAPLNPRKGDKPVALYISIGQAF